MENLEKYITLAPVDVAQHATRLVEVMKLKENIVGTIKTFEKYASAGKEVCSCMSKLADSLTGYTEFQSDPTLGAISGLLQTFRGVFDQHYDLVQNSIVASLKQFVKDDIGQAEETGKKAKENIDAYLKMTDSFAGQNKKKIKVVEQEEKDMKLMVTHWNAVNSDFQFARAVELVERKKLIELTGHLVSFIQHATVTYKQCKYESEQCTETFTQLQECLPESAKAIKEYKDQTEPLGKSLWAQQELYWRRLGMAFPGTNALSHEGYLWKKGSGITKSWQRRYFICRNNELAYYHNADDSGRPQGTLPLLLTSVKVLNDPERRFCFTIISQKKTYTLQALTEWDMNEWKNIIENNIQHLLDNVQTPHKQISEPGAEVIAPQSLQGNGVCCDCGDSCPTWCCINWGNCICIRCSGVHRELTTTVSKVRSLTLDRMEDKILQLMSVIGNEKANSILEAKVNEMNAGDLDRRGSDRAQFIKRKYQDCEFVDDTEEIDIEKAIIDEQVMLVYKYLCQMRKRHETNDNLLKIAASCGNPTICLLIGLNSEGINNLDEGGWSALSYAAYYGNSAAAKALMAIGCNPSVSTQAHPYAVATAMGHSGLATTFLPYWKDSDGLPKGPFEPQLKVTNEGHIEMDNSALSRTLSLITQAAGH